MSARGGTAGSCPVVSPRKGPCPERGAGSRLGWLPERGQGWFPALRLIRRVTLGELISLSFNFPSFLLACLMNRSAESHAVINMPGRLKRFTAW